MSEEDPDLQLIDEHVNKLMEHFDSVQIFVTRQSDGGDVTHCANRGAGNWYARYGQVMEYIHRQEERTRIDTRKE